MHVRILLNAMLEAYRPVDYSGERGLGTLKVDIVRYGLFGIGLVELCLMYYSKRGCSLGHLFGLRCILLQTLTSSIKSIYASPLPYSYNRRTQATAGCGCAAEENIPECPNP